MSADANSGAYRLYLLLPRELTVTVGRRGTYTFPAGTYVYVGSAKRGLSQRVARHERLGREKSGKRHWHVDYLLLDPGVVLFKAEALSGADECELAAQLARREDVSVPVPGFGATDCRNGCAAHLFRLGGEDCDSDWVIAVG